MRAEVTEMRTVAILAASPALTLLLGATIASDLHLRSRTFESAETLITYVRLVTADLVVLDLDAGEEAAELAEAIRCDEQSATRGTHIIALSRTVTDWTKRVVVRAGIDELILKPMSPRYLLDRVRALTLPAANRIVLANGYLGPERRNRFVLPTPRPFAPRRASDNVVALFPKNRAVGLSR